MKRFLSTILALVLSVSVLGQTITVDPNTSYQTIIGWEATAQAGHEIDASDDNETYEFPSSTFANYKTNLLNAMVSLGLNRVRLEIRADDVHAGGSYEYGSPHSLAIQPSTAAANQWHFERLQHFMDAIGTDWRNALIAQGETLHITISLVDYRQTGYKLEDDANEFAFFFNKVVDWFYTTYGYLPDALEVNEPDNQNGDWSAAKYANGIVAADALLSSNGYSGIEWVAPTTARLSNVNTWIADMKTAQPGVTSLIGEYSYHLYFETPSDSDLSTLKATALADGKTTLMGESHTGVGGANADYQRLYKDLTTGYGASWQQYVITYPHPSATDDGGSYFQVNTSTWAVTESSRTKQLKQYFKYMRKGCVVKGVTNSDSNYKGLPCRHANGRYVVPIWQNGTSNVTVNGLPAGTYGRTYALDNGTTGSFSNVTISEGQSVTCQLASAGVCTIYDINYAQTTTVYHFFSSP